MRIDPNYITGLTGSLSAISAREQQLTQQLSSGSRVNQLSDDSVAVSAAARLQSELAINDTFVRSASTVNSRMQASDSAMGTVVQQLTQAITLSTQANNGTLSTGARDAMKLQLQGVRDSVLAAANTSYSGQYLFSGSDSNNPAFDSSGSYIGDTAVQHVTSPAGQQIATNMPGSSIFSQALSALNDAIMAVTTGDTTATGKLSDALNTVTSQRSAFSASIAQLQAASDVASQRKTAITVAQTDLLSADPAQVATDLSNAQVQQKALLSVIASLGKSNLFDFL